MPTSIISVISLLDNLTEGFGPPKIYLMGLKKLEAQRRQRVKTRELSAREKALKNKAEYDALVKGRKKIMVPHPTIRNTWIEKFID